MPSVTNRASPVNLALSLLAFGVFMILLLVAVGFGVGSVELRIWLALVAIGVTAIVRRHQSAQREDPRPT
jgi:hypothetical protein